MTPVRPFTIEGANWRDLNALRHIEKVCFPLDSWSVLDLIGVLTLPNVVRLKAVVDGNMVGFVAGDPQQHPRQSWIATIGVLPEYRGQRIGAALLKACEERLVAPSLRLCVRASNEVAIRMYRTAGYEQVGRWKVYYSDREDAVVMEKRR